MRDEPKILSDLIRLHMRLERKAGALPLATSGQVHDRNQLEADAALIEEARAALHRLTVGAGKQRAPFTWWATLCASSGYVMGALIYGSTQWPALVVIPCGGLFLVLISIIADWRRK